MSHLVILKSSKYIGKYVHNKYIDKRFNKIHKLINDMHCYCVGVSSLSVSKDAIDNIQKVLKDLENGKNS